MISTRSVELVIDTVVCLTLANWETVSGQFGGYLTSGSLCRTIYLQRCRSQLVASGSYDANGRDNERIRHCNRQRILQASSVEPAGTDNTMSWLAIWRV